MVEEYRYFATAGWHTKNLQTVSMRSIFTYGTEHSVKAYITSVNQTFFTM